MARSPGQVSMTVSIDQRLVTAVDKARGYKPRALFVREAIVEYILVTRSPARSLPLRIAPAKAAAGRME